MVRGLKGGHALSSTQERYIDAEQHNVISCVDSCDDSTTVTTILPKGLRNIGNSCYANAVIQCLLNTALTDALNDPTANVIFRRYSSNPNILAQGSGSVDSEDDCATHTDASAMTAISATSSVVKRKQAIRERKQLEYQSMLERSVWLKQELVQISREYHTPEPRRLSHSWLYPAPERTVVDPGSITRSPNQLCSSLKPYHQEDAHEFLRALLGTLVMHGQNKELSSLFDGLLESSVTCQTCFRPSLTRDRYMDLSLDIARVGSMAEALQEFTSTEVLSGDNSVYCRNCEKKCTATKGLRLATAPSILVTHFKRFAYNRTGRMVRLSKHIEFPTTLEIGDFMSKVNQSRPPPYELVAVLVHQGVSCDSGHYLAYVKHGQLWYKCNDAVIEQVDLKDVLKQQAYILMYEVAKMREDHGYSRHNRRPRDAPPADFFSFTTKMLCGIDENFSLPDFCQIIGGNSRNRRRKTRRRNKEQSRDDLSTLGESTVESSRDRARNRFRRSASSGNLRREQHVQGRSSSVSASQRRNSEAGCSNTPKAPTTRSSSGTYLRQQQRPQPPPNRDLPPRPNRDHRRVMSEQGKLPPMA